MEDPVIQDSPESWAKLTVIFFSLLVKISKK
jgi:hypothetical protein